MKKLTDFLTKLAPYTAGLLRILTGVLMAANHGWGKISNPTKFLSGGAMQDFPFPTAMGWFAILAESVFAVTLALGLFTRASALALFGTMAGAAFIVHRGDAFGDRELALFYGAVSLFFVTYGGGPLSVDSKLFKG